MLNAAADVSFPKRMCLDPRAVVRLWITLFRSHTLCADAASNVVLVVAVWSGLITHCGPAALLALCPFMRIINAVRVRIVCTVGLLHRWRCRVCERERQASVERAAEHSAAAGLRPRLTCHSCGLHTRCDAAKPRGCLGRLAVGRCSRLSRAMVSGRVAASKPEFKVAAHACRCCAQPHGTLQTSKPQACA